MEACAQAWSARCCSKGLWEAPAAVPCVATCDAALIYMARTGRLGSSSGSTSTAHELWQKWPSWQGASRRLSRCMDSQGQDIQASAGAGMAHLKPGLPSGHEASCEGDQVLPCFELRAVPMTFSF